MADLISRQAAIDALDDYILDEVTDLHGDSVREILERLPTAEPQWIPCKEMMPKYNVPVLTWDGEAYCVEMRIPFIRDEDGNPIEGEWWCDPYYVDDDEYEWYGNLRDGAAEIWMPLPKPYCDVDMRGDNDG